MKYEDLLEKDDGKLNAMRYWLEIITPVRIVDAEVLTMIYFSLFLV